MVSYETNEINYMLILWFTNTLLSQKNKIKRPKAECENKLRKTY